jgi:hypothetical protein
MLPAARGGAVAAADQGSAFTFLGGGPSDVLTVNPATPAWTASVWSDPSFEDTTSVAPGVGILGSASLLVFGGNQGGAVADAVQYSPATGPQVVASMHSPRELLGSATDQQGKVYAIGGIDDNGTPLKSMEYYTQSKNAWTVAAPLPQTLYAESAAYDGNGHIFTFGGVGAAGTILNTTYEYTIATNTWSVAAPMPSAVRDGAAVLASNNLIYVLGGNTSAGTTAAVESYNPATNTWNTETSLPSPVSNEAVVSDSLGRIEILGGFDSSGNALANVWVSQQLNQPDTIPSITTTAPTTAWTGTPYAYQVYSTGNPQATYSLTAKPNGMNIDPNTGLITWAPTQPQVGVVFTVTVQASNAAGQSSQTYNVTVKQSPPTVPSGVYQSGETVDSATLSWNPSTGPIGIDHYNVYHYYGTGHSGRGGGITYHYDLLGSSTTPSFTISGLTSGGTFTWYIITAVDPNGLSSGYSSVYTIHTLPDTVPPVLTLPPNQTVTAASPSGATDPGAFTATATDPGPGIDNISIVYVAGSNQIPTSYVFPVGTTTVTAIARDMYGNYTSGSFTVTVVSSFPVLSLPPNQIVEQTSSSGATDPGAFTATATDPQDSIASITYAVNGTQIDSSYLFAPGTTTVTVTATDTSGYSNSGTFTVLVEDIPPTLALSGLPPNNNTVYEGTAINVTANATAGTPAENAAGLSFTWNVTKVHNGVTTNNYFTGSGTGSSDAITFIADDEGTYTLNVTATDVNGTSTTVSQTITSWPLEPTLVISGPSDGVVYQNRMLTFTASSPSPIDQASPFTYNINWGDGNTQTITGDSSIAVGHVYNSTGSYTVSAYPTDAGGFFGPTSTQSVTIGTIEQQSDSASQGGITGLAIGGTPGDDNIQITTGATSGTVTVALNGTNLGTFTPTGNSLFVFGGTGTETVTFKALSGAGTFSLAGQTLSYSNSGTGVPLFNLSLALASDVENLVVQGGSTGSSYTIQDAAVATTLNAGVGKDTFTFADTGGATQAVMVNGGGGTNTLIGSDLTNFWNLTGSGAGTLQGGSEPDDPFTGIQNLIGGSGADSFYFASNAAAVGGIDGQGGTNTLDYSGRTAAVTVTLASGGLNKGTAIAGTWNNVQTLIGSQATTNRLIGPSATTTWTITGTNSGTVAGVAFSSIEGLTGGAGNDTFVFSGSGNVTGAVNGGGGTNTIDVSGYTSASTVNLQTKTATPIGGTLSSITSFVGDNSTSTLIGPNATTTWSVTATNKGTVGSTSFSGFVNLTGGTGNDTFKLSNGVGVTGTIDGGAGANTLDYSAYTTGIVVDLLIPTATNIGAIANIQNVKSGTGNSILVGNGGSNNFTVKGGHNVVIGGGGVYKLTGGTGQDILIAGTTSYDSNLVALDAILAYWGRTDLTYAQEVNGLSTLGVTYQDSSGTHTAILNATTVFDNGLVDTLAGGSGQEWFIAHQTGSDQDVITGRRNGEVITDI